MWTLILMIVFAGALALTIIQHVHYLTGRRPLRFMPLLETAGWLVLVLTSGIGLVRPEARLLSVSAGGVGALFVVIGSLTRGADRG